VGAAAIDPEAEDVVREISLRALLDRFAAAFEDGDVTALAALLADDVTLETPPVATWFSGREAVLGSLAANLCRTAGRIRLAPAAANGQPAFAAFLRGDDGRYGAHAVIVLALTGPLITRVVIFLEPALFRLFGLDQELAPACFPRWQGLPEAARKNLSQGLFSSTRLGLESSTWCLRRRHVHAISACVLARPHSPRLWLEGSRFQIHSASRSQKMAPQSLGEASPL
jgi:SnoaL-like domain